MEKLIEKKEKKINTLETELEIIKTIKIPIRAELHENGKFQLYSKDFSLATGFTVKKTSDLKSSTSDYDGGYMTHYYEYYPEFFFKIDKYKVHIQTKSFENSKDKIFRKETSTQGSGDCHHMTNYTKHSVDYEQVIKYYQKIDVPEKLIKKLKLTQFT